MKATAEEDDMKQPKSYSYITSEVGDQGQDCVNESGIDEIEHNFTE